MMETHFRLQPPRVYCVHTSISLPVFNQQPVKTVPMYLLRYLFNF